MQPDKQRPKITIKRKPRTLEAVAAPTATLEATEPAVQVASTEGERIQPEMVAVEPVAPAPEELAEQAADSELTAKQLKKQRRRERKAAEEAEAARVAELQAEAERVAAAAVEAARIAEEEAEAARVAEAKAVRIAEARAERAARRAALTPEGRAAQDAQIEAERVAGEVRRSDALAILNKNPIFAKFLPLEVGGGKKLAKWAFEKGKGTISMKAAREVVAAHCRHKKYLKATLLRFKRYDPISWQPVGEVTQAEKDFARLKLKRTEAKDSGTEGQIPPSGTEGQEPLSSD